MGKFLRDFFQNSSITVPAVLIFIFLYFQKHISLFIETFLMSDPAYNVWYLQLIIVVAFFVSVVLLFKKLVLNKYMPATAEYLFICLSFLLFLYYRFNGNGLNWNLHAAVSNRYFSILYIELILVLLLSYFVFNSIGWCLKQRKKIVPVVNFLISDDPILTEDQDLVNFSPTVGKLADILLSDKHPKSISIGLIGPWGNGKSSVIQMTKSKIDSSEQFKKNEIIVIHFLPYLNHNESDIINEFFTLLSNALSPYSGRLSNQIVDYSEKLTDLYQNKSLSTFLENHITNFTQSSACELYENINKMLDETDKKIIVFIDDLDRLNQKEILQTLKLIRNTANFTNTFFVLAMDKQYVIKRLTEKGNILDTKFVDKFFQLEIYLPEIDNSLLKQYFTKEMLRPFTPAPADLEFRLKAALLEPNLLFKDYVKNFRDVKRVVNQIKYDLSLFQEDFAYLNLKDFINFTFFKLKFPQFLKHLNDSRGDFLTIDKSRGIYNLIKIKKEANANGIVEKLIHLHEDEAINSISHLDKYQLFSEVLGNTEQPKNINEKSSRTDKVLLIKTLAHLFGDENPYSGHDSIKNANVFQMLIEQRIFPNFFKQSEFEVLFNVEKQGLELEILKIKQLDKEEQLIRRLEYYSTDNEQKLKRVIEFMMMIYQINGAEYRFDIDTYKIIEKFTARLYDLMQEDRTADYRKWLDDSIFSDKAFSEESRLTLLGTIWMIKDNNELWHFTQKYVSDKVLELYKKYLSGFNPLPWAVNDFSANNLHREIKAIDTDKINTILKNYWSEKPIEYLCAQLTRLDAFSNTAFKISDTVIEMFGTIENYISFVKSHKDSSLPEIKEFITLFDLLQMIHFKFALEYDFVLSSLMIEKIMIAKNDSDRSEYGMRKRPQQVIIKVTDIDLGYKFSDIANYKEKYLYTRSIFGNEMIYVIDITYEKIDRHLSDFITDILTLYYATPKWTISSKVIAEGTRIDLKDSHYIEFISIKPKPQDEIKYLDSK